MRRAAALILAMKKEGLPLAFQATGPAIGLCIALVFAWVSKAHLLVRELHAPVSGWRWDLAWATGAGVAVGAAARLLLPPAWQLAGVPVILVAFGAVLWLKGFGPEDRELFRMRKTEISDLRDAEERERAREALADDVV